MLTSDVATPTRSPVAVWLRVMRLCVVIRISQRTWCCFLVPLPKNKLGWIGCRPLRRMMIAKMPSHVLFLCYLIANSPYCDFSAAK
jgi:hypothetical protein